MATIKPIGLRTDGVFKVIDPNTDELDAKILVSQPGVVLGRVTAGAGPHEEILFGDLPGGGSYIEVTYAEMQVLLNDATLQKGSFYKITDASGTDLGFVCQAVRADEITVNGTGGFLNQDFKSIGDYSGVEAVTGIPVDLSSAVGVWRDWKESNGLIVTGRIVFWNGLHYQCIDQSALGGWNPAIDIDDHGGLAYAILPKTETNVGYVEAWDESEYLVSGNSIMYRSDTLNSVRGGSVAQFQWGNNANYGNIVNTGTLNCSNSISAIVGNILENGASMYVDDIRQSTIQFNTLAPNSSIFISIDSDSLIANNILENGAQLTGITAGSNCSISRNKIGPGATLGGSTTMGDGAQIDDNSLASNSVLSGIFGIGAQFSKNNIGIDGQVVDSTTLGEYSGISLCQLFNGSGFSGLVLEDGASLQSAIFAPNTGMTSCTIGSNVYITFISVGKLIQNKTFSSDITLTRNESGFSNFYETIDITGITTLDCLVENNYVGIFNLTSSNATESLDTIQNFPILFPFKLYPASGLTLTITGTAIGGIGAGQIALPVASIVLNGTNGEWIELEPDSTNTYLKYKNSLSGVI